MIKAQKLNESFLTKDFSNYLIKNFTLFYIEFKKESLWKFCSGTFEFDKRIVKKFHRIGKT